jgi:predicted double-glycine peptidase
MRIFRRITSLFLIILGGFVGWHARAIFGPPGAPPTATPAPFMNRGTGLQLLDGVPDVRQSTAYSCGTAVLQAVLHYYGIEEREDRLMKELNTTAEQGTHPADILRVAKLNGLRAELREGLSFEDLKAALDRGIPVIAAIQAWKDRDKKEPAWENNWEDGHYVIILGLDEASVYVEDPSLLGCRGIIPREEFLARWHDYEGPPPFGAGRRAYVRMGIFIEGRPPAQTHPYCRVD